MEGTPEDVFGRIRGRHCITASNVAKYDGFHAVVIFDPYLTGDNRQPFTLRAPSSIPHFTCYNASTAGERVREIVFLANRLGPIQGVSERNLVGVGSAGVG